MSTNRNYLSSDKTGSNNNGTFIELSDAELITEENLRECADQDEVGPIDVEKELFIAVARVDGVISHGPSPMDMNDGAVVLYMNSDNEAAERWFYEPRGTWENIPHSCLAPTTSGKEGTDWMKEAVKKVVSHHRKIRDTTEENNDE